MWITCAAPDRSVRTVCARAHLIELAHEQSERRLLVITVGRVEAEAARAVFPL